MAPTFNAAEVYTMAEMAQFYESDGRLSTLINNLRKDDPVMEHILWKMGNLTDGHKHKIVSKIPTPSFRRLYKGATRTKAGIAMVTETTTQTVDRWEIDVDELKIYEGNAEAQNSFRMQEGALHIQGMREFVTTNLFYGDPDNDIDEPRGVAARYAYKDGPNVVDAGGTTVNQTSIFALVFGDRELFGFYPKNMKMGIQHEDLGVYDAYDEAGKPYRVVGDEWKWNFGFTIGDYTSCARLCNIPVANLSITDPDDAGYIDLGNLTIDLKNKIPTRLRGRIKFYVGNAVMTALEKQARSSKNMYLHYGQWQDSSEVLKMHGKPVFECDSISETEAVLPALP